MSKEKKKFKIGGFLKKVGKPLGGVLGLAGDLMGIDALEKIGDALEGPEANVLTPEEKAQAIQLVKEDKIEYYKDLDSARQMQATIATSANATKLSKNYVYYFSMFWSLIGAAFIIMSLFVDIPEENVRLVDTAFGFLLGTALAQMFAFFFGSSQGSKDKTSKLMKDLQDIGK